MQQREVCLKRQPEGGSDRVLMHDAGCQKCGARSNEWMEGQPVGNWKIQETDEVMMISKSVVVTNLQNSRIILKRVQA